MHPMRPLLSIQANIAVLAELERVRNEPSPLVAVQQRLAEHNVDADKFEKLIDNLQVRENEGRGWCSPLSNPSGLDGLYSVNTHG